MNTLPDNGRKKQQINVKDNFWPVTGRSKGVLDMWFRDLAGTKPLANLAKKAPSFNKKEEIFTYLCDHQVSMKKAMWFLKLSAAYTTTVTEQKIKKRQMPDPSIEWTATVIRVMKDLSQKLIEHYVLEKNPKVINTQQAAITSGTSSNVKCNRCSIDKQLTPIKCTKEKNAMINKEKSDGKPTAKVKSLREKVLNRSLMKDIRFRELKLTKRKSLMVGPQPAKRAKQTLRVTRVKSRIKRESTLVQQQPQQPGTSDGPELSTNASDGAVAIKGDTDDANNADAKDRSASKLVRKRLAMKKRYGLPSISQIIADLLAKRAKNRAKQRLNEKSAEAANQLANSEDVDGKNGTNQTSTSPGSCSTTNATVNRSNPLSSKSTLSGKPNTNQSFQSQQHANVESPTTSTTGFSNFSSSGRETPSASATSASSSNSSSSSSSSSSSNHTGHTFITPAVPTTPGNSSAAIEDFPTILRHWKYCTRLCRAMCEESLLDRHEFLQWALELLDRMRNKSSDDGFLKLYLPFILQCLPYIVESERLSRRLAYLVCKKIGFMLHYVTEEDGNAVSVKKLPPPQSSSTMCCDSNIATNRLDPGLKMKQEPEIRAPLSTRSASTRYKKFKMDPTTPPPLSAPASPSTASIDSPEDVLSTKSLLGSNYLPARPNTNQDRKNIGARPYSSTSPASKQLSSSQTPPQVSPPTASPPSISSNATSIMPIGTNTTQSITQTISTKNQSLGVIKHRQRPSTHFMETMLRDFLLCEHHRPVIMELSAMIQAITLRCPGALVWCGLSGKERDSITPLAGGPLEYMPVLPSQLPMPSNNRRHNDFIRKRLREVEQQIVERSKHSEKRWVADKWLRKTIDGQINEVILSTLSILDAHCFDRLDGNNNNLASLYTKLFQPVDKVMKQVR